MKYKRGNLTPEEIQQIKEMRDQGCSQSTIAEKVGCSMRTVNGYAVADNAGFDTLGDYLRAKTIEKQGNPNYIKIKRILSHEGGNSRSQQSLFEREILLTGNPMLGNYSSSRNFFNDESFCNLEEALEKLERAKVSPSKFELDSKNPNGKRISYVLRQISNQKSFSKVGIELGLSYERVRQIYQQGLEVLREIFMKE